MTADEWYHEQHDGDVRRDADRFDREAEHVTVEQRSDRPQDVQERGRVVAEVARLVEAAGADLREALRPCLEGSDVGREPLRAHREEPDDHAERDHRRDRELRAALAATSVVVHCQYSNRVIAIVA